MSIQCRGVRGATTAERNTREAILEATHELLAQLVEVNGIDPEDIASVFFTTTRDLDADFPAIATRAYGWGDVAILCAHEMEVPGALESCIRVLIHWNTPKPQAEIRHVYLREASRLRPDRAARGEPSSRRSS